MKNDAAGIAASAPSLAAQTENTTAPAFDTGYDRLTASFAAVAAIKSPSRQRYALNKVAPYHGLPRGECKGIFAAWLIEQASQGVRS